MDIIDLTSLDRLNALTAKHPNVLIVISRNDCAGCETLDQALHANTLLKDALEDHEVIIGKVKLETVPTAAAVFGLRQAPAMILFREDDEVSRLTGFEKAAPLLQALRHAFDKIVQVA